MLIQRASRLDGRRVDVRVCGDRIESVGSELEPRTGERRLDAAGGVLVPGLHDHHLHLFAWAAARTSVRCGPPEVCTREALARTLQEAQPVGSWIRGVGYHESVAGWLDRDALDRFVSDRPVRIQHRGGALWILNSRALDLLGVDPGADMEGVERDLAGRATGRLWRSDAWLSERFGERAAPSLEAVSRELARFGVVGVTDAGCHNGPDVLARLRCAWSAGELRQHVLLMGDERLSPLAAAGEGDSCGVEIGPQKLMLDDARLPELGALAERIRGAHVLARNVAVHCTTRGELWLALVAFEAAGVHAGDRIEHASVAPPEATYRVRELGLSVVTQPNFIAERGDQYRSDVEPADRPWLYRGNGWIEAGVPLGAGTDAPFGAPDPWAAMAAAVERRTRSGAVLGERESLEPERALGLFTTPARAPGGPPRRVEPGAPADLCLLDRPWREQRSRLGAARVRLTLLRGEVLYEA